MLNQIQKQTGAAGFSKPTTLLVMLLLVVFFGYIIASKGFVTAVILIMLPFLLIIVTAIFQTPKLAIYIVVAVGFVANGLSRYISGPPYGLSIDAILFLAYLAIFFKDFYHRIDWSLAASNGTTLALIWFGYTLFELVNPEALSRVAWFYAMRGVSLYQLMIIPLVLLLFRDYKDFNKFLYLWGFMSLLGSLKGFMQATIGVDPWEQAWLDGGGNITHILFGKLRVFSFYSDAGQFGASQGHAGVMGTIIFLHAKLKKEKIFFGIVAIAGIYGMFISGTRGAIAVPFAGFFLYFILTRNIKLITIGATLGIIVFIFFKFTLVGNDIYAIRRMRTAFDPEDKSLQVRLDNQKKLKTYLASRPFGGGIGAAGYWGLRFSPNGFLANVPTDSWYVNIWADQGIVGLTLHLIILFLIVGNGSYLAMFKVRDPVLQAKLFALASGILGIMAASYGNGVLGQIPTSTILYTSMGFLFLAEPLDKSITESQQIENANQ